jgi:hypothetical protein
MTLRLLNLRLSAHQRVQDLLPWYVMESLDGEDRAFVDEHLAACLICQRDVQWHCELRSAHDEAVPPFDVERALASMKAAVAARKSEQRPSYKPRASWAPWVGWAIAAQVAVIACFVAVTKLPEPASPAIYRALGHAAASDASSRLLVVFAAQVTEEEMRRILRDSGARIVDGPTSTDAYVLHVSPQRAKAALLALRAEHAVTLVESLDPEAPH